MRGLRSELERAEKAHKAILNLQESSRVGVIMVKRPSKPRIVPKNGPGHRGKQEAFGNGGFGPFLEDQVASKSASLSQESFVDVETLPGGQGVETSVLNKGGKEILEFPGPGD